MLSHIVVNGENIEYDDFCRWNGDAMRTDKEWQARVKGILKAELKRRDVGYKELADRLALLGVTDSERNIANKIARGGFSAVFFVQCLAAIGCNSVTVAE